jgi:hypothetical protein
MVSFWYYSMWSTQTVGCEKHGEFYFPKSLLQKKHANCGSLKNQGLKLVSGISSILSTSSSVSTEHESKLYSLQKLYRITNLLSNRWAGSNFFSESQLLSFWGWQSFEANNGRRFWTLMRTSRRLSTDNCFSLHFIITVVVEADMLPL